ncbi:MAG: hypothetical protein L0H64_13200 [Pseudonocardia sp.]|nr:hypothetical protein [Pseudonocardia sp.]
MDPTRSGRRALDALAVALLTATCWWGWMAWGRGYRDDPATGTTSGPYGAWQVVGCAVCLVAFGALLLLTGTFLATALVLLVTAGVRLARRGGAVNR